MGKTKWFDESKIAEAEAPNKASEGAEAVQLPEGIEIAFWDGRQWYKVGSHMFADLDRALEELKNK